MTRLSLPVALLQLILFVSSGVAAVVAESGESNANTCSAEDGSCTDENTASVGTVPCEDGHQQCSFWASQGECEANPNYMLHNCRKSCNTCKDMLVLPSIEDDLEFDLGEKQNLMGPRAYEIRDVLEKTIDYMRTEVMVDPKYTKVMRHCKNRHVDCSLWALVGECEANPNYMQLQCAPSCQTCDLIDYETRCPMTDLPPDALHPGDLNNMFERITTAEENKQYNPQILSMPMKEKSPKGNEPVKNPEEQKRTSITDRLASIVNFKKGESDEENAPIDGPWVVILDDFISPEECDKLIELGAKEGYERSADVGKIKFDGTFESNINDGRTSKNAWCNKDCYKDPVAIAVMERIANVTGIEEKNSEYLQILKYEVGEYYRQHHDYIPHQVDRQSGVRTITVFLYLNDVEAGGGTQFSNLKLTVTPKRGRALLWPSVLDSNPNQKDSRTYHAALPVEQGIKYGANAWLHQKDFKTPNENNCQ